VVVKKSVGAMMGALVSSVHDNKTRDHAMTAVLIDNITSQEYFIGVALLLLGLTAVWPGQDSISSHQLLCWIIAHLSNRPIGCNKSQMLIIAKMSLIKLPIVYKH